MPGNVDLVAELVQTTGTEHFTGVYNCRRNSNSSLALQAPVVMVGSHSLDSIDDNSRATNQRHGFLVLGFRIGFW